MLIKNTTLDETQTNPFKRLVINWNPRNTSNKPTIIKKAPINGLKKSTVYFPGRVKSLHASGPEIKTFAAQSPSDVIWVVAASWLHCPESVKIYFFLASKAQTCLLLYVSEKLSSSTTLKSAFSKEY